jgi:hypothetical protein
MNQVSYFILVCMRRLFCYFQFNLVRKDVIIPYCIKYILALKRIIIRGHNHPRLSRHVVNVPKDTINPSRTMFLPRHKCQIFFCLSVL